MTTSVRSTGALRNRLLRRSSAPVLAAALALGVALTGCSSSDAGAGGAGGSSSETSSQTESAPKLTNPDVSKIRGFSGKPGSQQIISTGVLDLIDEVTELGFQDEKGDRYTAPELSDTRDEWPADAYSTQILLLKNGQIALRWHCDAVDGPRLNYSDDIFCDSGGYLILLEPGDSPEELPQVDETVVGPWEELNERTHIEIGNDTVKSVMWPGYNPVSPVPPKVMVDGVYEQVIAAVQPDSDDPMVYFLKPGSFELHVGELALAPKELQKPESES